jgi:hypothetical protein
MTLFGIRFDVTKAEPWSAAMGLLIGGFIVSLFAWKAVGRAWAGIIHTIQERSA